MVERLLGDAAALLGEAGLPSPQADARILLAHVLDCEPAHLLLAEEPSVDQVEQFAELIAKRYSGIPVQQLTGVAWFRYTSVKVGEGVFIPRPETEGLVQLGLDWLTGQHWEHPPIVVDLGTGSGAIAKSLAAEFPARVYAVELDEQAYPYAEGNLAGSGVKLRQGDFASAFPDLDGLVDLVISNPPYIPLAHACLLPEDVLGHDPNRALFSGEDGLDAIRQLAPVAARLLKPGGLVVVEHDDSQGESAPAVFQQHGGFTEISDHRDLAGRPRYLRAVFGLR